VPVRKHIRLEGYNYNQNGAYFITVCSYRRSRTFGEIVVGQGLCSCQLSYIGNCIEEEIKNMQSRYADIVIDKYTIMPNHIHMILAADADWQEQSPCPTIGDILCAFKSITTKKANSHDNTPGRKIWQYRYHDHIIRNADEYLKIWQYIDSNHSKWQDDCYFA
jgi:REP element-mobilizing transposase RayT